MSKRLIVHQPTNHLSKNYRYYNIFFDNFIEKLSENHDVITNRYHRDAHICPKSVVLNYKHNGNDVHILTYECEMIIEDFDTEEIYVFGVADDLTPATLNLQSFDKIKKIFISQFIRDKVNHHVLPENRHKYFPWIYFPSNEYDLDFYYNLRKNINKYNDKIYFRGDTSTRPILNYFTSDFFYGGGPIGGFESYVKEMLNFKIALSVAGRGEICYRDVECMAMGIPLIRFEFTSELYEPLVPNYHYISVERPDDLKDWMKLDRNGKEHHAEMITKRFIDIKNDEEFLNFISKNARNYYENFLSPKNSINYTLKLLEL